ncbi:MAG: hypothetical protein MUO78_09830 [candidate division Zixibacteria bacterium]|nr:hypothetical protein [candidate division Zixibacteria bacterium]
MKKPNIENMCEMAVRIPDGSLGENIKSLQNKVIPVISKLKEECGVQWYCFLIHNNKNGLPISYEGFQFHIRFENTNNLSIDELKSKLPEYCEMIRKIDPSLREISCIDTSLLKGDDIQEAWKIIGESCEWIIEMLNAHKMVEDITLDRVRKQIEQFQHYIKNITMIGFQ